MSEIYHHGIKGQRWGVRRFQNEDGSLTEAGRKRYGYSIAVDHDSHEITTREKLRRKYAEWSKQKTANREKRDAEKQTKKESIEAEKKQKLEEKRAEEREALMDEAKRNPETMSKLTNEELQKVLTRMNLEKQYLNNMDELKKERGKSVVQKIVSATNSAANIATNVANLKSALDRMKSDPSGEALKQLQNKVNKVKLDKEYKELTDKNEDKKRSETLEVLLKNQSFYSPEAMKDVQEEIEKYWKKKK